MNKNYLLASVALFGELYKSDTFQSIPEIIAEFIKGAVVFEKRYSVNSTELKDLLKKVYGFNIPESVIRTTLKNRLKDCVVRENNCYHFDINKLDLQRNTIEELDSISAIHDNIIQKLFIYIEERKAIELSDQQKEKIRENLSQFLMDNGYADEYSDLISAFIIKNENSSSFSKDLNAIREGLILYQGINYSEDISKLGSWKEKMTIYLSTENLFNCVGYNGSIFQEIFADFLKLVNEINTASRNSNGEKLIQLKYLEETKNEIDNFFQSAELIKKGHKQLDQTKIAMVSILDGCSDVVHVREKQINFYIGLKKMGIEEKEFHFESSDPEFNVVDEKLIESLKRTSDEKNKFFDEQYCMQCLRIFTKINNFRRGTNNVSFEKIRHIYITENNFAKYLGHNNSVKFNEFDIAFAKDIDYVITKFWFKLKKGFNDKSILPKSFDVVTKAKIIISSHLNNSLSRRYEELRHDFKSGKLTEELAVELNRGFKEKPNAPELVTEDNIDDSMLFLEKEDFVENVLRERTRKDEELKQALIDKNQLKQELEKYKQKDKEDARKDHAEKLLIQSEEYAANKWKELEKNNLQDFLYSVRIFILAVLPVAVGLFLKLYRPVSLWIDSIGTYSIAIYITLIVLFGLEIIGRSYLFDRVRIKNGWEYSKRLFLFKSKQYKASSIDDFKLEFIQKY